MSKFLLAALKVILPFGLSVLVLLAIYGFLGGPAFVFWMSAAAAILPGIFILTSEDIVRTAFWLLCSLTGFAGFYGLLGADFLAVTQIMVYLGGIMILILFGVLLTAKAPAVVRRMPRLNLIVPGLGAAAIIFAGIYGSLRQAEFADKSKMAASAELRPLVGTTIYQIGERLLTDFVLPFEVASILLLAALVGAAYMARSGSAENPPEAN